MTDERNPVLCPWCGFEMAAYTISIQGYSGEKTCFYECAQCCARSPIAITNKDAYAAATRRPPNRPMTREQIENSGLQDNDAVWIMSRTNENAALHLIDGCSLKQLMWECRISADTNTWVWLRRKPTPEDIEAARKERNG